MSGEAHSGSIPEMPPRADGMEPEAECEPAGEEAVIEGGGALTGRMGGEGHACWCADLTEFQINIAESAGAQHRGVCHNTPVIITKDMLEREYRSSILELRIEP